MSEKQISHLGEPSLDRLIVETWLRQPMVISDVDVRTGSVAQHPFRKFEIIVTYGDRKMPASSRSVASHPDHRPFRIIPIFALSGFQRELVHPFQEPQNLAVEMDVVNDLDVVRVGPALE